MLGKGGFATVYQATNRLTQESLAVKWMQVTDNCIYDEQSIQSEIELQSFMGVQCMNIAKIYNYTKYEIEEEDIAVFRVAME